ncbi:LOW QUALITY PROTEIN: EF-hand and coiled-coil domain-containing protein 1 [Discoglossus pictus]
MCAHAKARPKIALQTSALTLVYQPHTGRLPLGKESEHIETQIRNPLRHRKKHPAAARSKHSTCTQTGACTRDCYEEIVALEQAEDRIIKLVEENSSIKKVVEDMRSLQTSDARSLGLQEHTYTSYIFKITYLPFL